MNGGRIASLSLDLDDKWTYMKIRGDERWKTLPSYLDVVVPRFLETLYRHGLKITVFIVGQDADQTARQHVLRSIARAGHELGNHSFRHEPWLHLYSPEEVDREIRRAGEAIEGATGVRPIGFRGPGFSFSPEVLNTLVRQGYQYDASTFPTFLGPIARAYYFLTAKIEKEQAEERGQLFGSFREGFRPLNPYRWELPAGRLVEIPVTTMPIVRAPFHVSYLLYLACYSPMLAKAYFRAALGMCEATGTQPSLLLHPPDLLGPGEAPELDFFPAMGLALEKKVALMDWILEEYSSRFRVVPMAEHARAI